VTDICREIIDWGYQQIDLIERRNREQLLITRSWKVDLTCQCGKITEKIIMKSMKEPTQEEVNYYHKLTCLDCKK
jgi:hypothetical protein